MSTDSPINILIVEDSATAAAVLLIQLEEGLTRQFSSVTVEMLAEVQACLGNGSFDLVMLDLNLPDSSGVETFTRLHHSFSNIPIIVLSGMAEESIALAVVRGGAQDYLVKSRLDDYQQINRAVKFSLERSRR
ncbi:MAG: response regulator, partial [Planctomycetales bacterium]